MKRKLSGRVKLILVLAVVLAAAAVLAKLAPRRDALLALALVPVLAAHFLSPNQYLYTQYAPRKAALSETETLPAVVLNQAGYEVAPDFFLDEFAKRGAVYQGSGQDDAASLRHAAETLDLRSGFVLYGYVYDADELLALAEDTLDVASAALLTDVAQCPVYYITLH